MHFTGDPAARSQPAGDFCSAGARTGMLAGLLGFAAVLEIILRQAPAGASGMYVLVLCLLGLAGTLPLACATPCCWRRR